MYDNGCLELAKSRGAHRAQLAFDVVFFGIWYVVLSQFWRFLPSHWEMIWQFPQLAGEFLQLVLQVAAFAPERLDPSDISPAQFVSLMLYLPPFVILVLTFAPLPFLPRVVRKARIAWQGEVLRFDRAANSLWCNGRLVATLDQIVAVHIKRSHSGRFRWSYSLSLLLSNGKMTSVEQGDGGDIAALSKEIARYLGVQIVYA
ncbi:MAG: hypothetical protein HY332_16760 [Chloroflexi bacterium]|nr:hypothetical protein [Chloroflexota bacterium]